MCNCNCRYENFLGLCEWAGGIPYPCPEQEEIDEKPDEYFIKEDHLSILTMLRNGYSINLKTLEISNGTYDYVAISKCNFNWLENVKEYTNNGKITKKGYKQISK